MLLGFNEYLIRALGLNRDLLIDSLISLVLENSFISDRLSKTEALTGLISTFINEVSDESELIEKLMKRSGNEKGVVKREAEVDETDGSPSSPISTTKLAISTCINLLGALKKEMTYNRDV